MAKRRKYDNSILPFNDNTMDLGNDNPKIYVYEADYITAFKNGESSTNTNTPKEVIPKEIISKNNKNSNPKIDNNSLFKIPEILSLQSDNLTTNDGDLEEMNSEEFNRNTDTRIAVCDICKTLYPLNNGKIYYDPNKASAGIFYCQSCYENREKTQKSNP